MAQSHVLILGVGAVGAVAAEDAARHGVGHITLVDPDVYGPMSHWTQPSLPEHVGRPKAFVQAEKLHAINPAVNLRAAHGFSYDLDLSDWRQCDVVFLAGDNLEMVVHAARLCQGLGIPLVQGAVWGESWLSIVRGYDLGDPEAPCPTCPLMTEDFQNLQSRFGCDPQTALLQGRQPTRTLPLLCGTAGHLVFAEGLKRLTGAAGLALHGEEVQFCLKTFRLYRTQLPRNPACRGPHRRWNLIDLAEPAAQVTLADLARRLGIAPTRTLQVRSDRPWYSRLFCSSCGQERRVSQFVRPGTGLGHCSCGRSLEADFQGRHAVIPADEFLANLDRPLSELGLGPGAAVGMAGEDDWTYFFVPPEAPAPVAS